MAHREQGRSTVAGERRQSSRRYSASSSGTSDAQAALEAEVTRLREANARLTAARDEPPDGGDVMGNARSLGSMPVERGNLADETAQMLVEGLVIRESLIEICHEMERSLVSFEARLDALATAADELVPLHGKPETEQEGGGDVVDG